MHSACGIMFHHFSDHVHPRGQGAISRDELAAMIRYLGPENILSPEAFATRALTNSLGPRDVCLTFDDALLCQYEVAAPVLADFNLSAFWFVYSSVLQGGEETLEIFRYFRTVAFDDIEQFYELFFKKVGYVEGSFDPSKYLVDDPFYTRNDKIFRYLRDDVMGPTRYTEVMRELMADAKFSIPAIKNALWMTNENLRSLKSAGHTIGLHSYKHPTRLAEMSAYDQMMEYGQNFQHLRDTLGCDPWAMSHPCNSYNPQTLDILRGLGVRVGFRAYVGGTSKSLLELPRLDHAILMQQMTKLAA